LSVFISHIGEEGEIGSTLKDCLNLAFDDKLTVFLSSDPEDLLASEEWLEGIVAHLSNAPF
jgi:hypothetical protein